MKYTHYDLNYVIGQVDMHYKLQRNKGSSQGSSMFQNFSKIPIFSEFTM